MVSYHWELQLLGEAGPSEPWVASGRDGVEVGKKMDRVS